MNLRPKSPSNPFSTRFIRPGATTYHFPEGVSVNTLAERFLQQLRGRGAIVGPHGSGKTSLLYALLPYLGQVVEHHLCSGDPLPPNTHPASTLPVNTVSPALSTDQLGPLRIFWFRLMMRSRDKSPQSHSHHPASRESLRALMRSRRSWGSDALVVVDGWEQLRWPLRGWIYWNAKRAHAKLLVTSHHKTILPTLWDSQVRPEIAQKVICQLLETVPENSFPVSDHWRDQICSPQRLQQALAENRGSLREVLFLLYDEYERTCRSDQ